MLATMDFLYTSVAGLVPFLDDNNLLTCQPENNSEESKMGDKEFMKIEE